MRFRITILLAVVLSSFCSSQNGITADPNWYIKPYFNFGVIMQHREVLGNLIKGYPKTYELNIVKPTLGSFLWQCENNKPDVGINLSLIDYANPQQLGYAIIAAPFVEVPLNEKEKLSRLYLRLCWGPAFVTKPFDLETNQKNGAIGSVVNAYVQFKWFWHIPVNKSIRLEPGFMFSHISNGRAQSPNLGLNTFGAGIAVNFNLTNKVSAPSNKLDSNTCNKSRNEIFIMNSYGFNDGEIKGRKQLVTTISIQYQYNKRNTHKFGIGWDINYEENYVKDLKVEGVKTNGLIDEIRYGPKLCYSYNIGRISFPLEMGIYVRQLIEPDGLFFHRMGVRYYGKKGLMLAFGMRSHWAVAYNFDYGIGYRWYLK